MASFVWNNNCETGLPTVDQQHRKLVDMLNHFSELLTLGAPVSNQEMESLV